MTLNTSQILRAFTYLPDDELAKLVFKGKQELRKRIEKYKEERYKRNKDVHYPRLQVGDRVVVERPSNLRRDLLRGADMVYGRISRTYSRGIGETFTHWYAVVLDNEDSDEKIVFDYSDREILAVIRKEI